VVCVIATSGVARGNRCSVVVDATPYRYVMTPPNYDDDDDDDINNNE